MSSWTYSVFFIFGVFYCKIFLLQVIWRFEIIVQVCKLDQVENSLNLF
jgi:hypothetical protein